MVRSGVHCPCVWEALCTRSVYRNISNRTCILCEVCHNLYLTKIFWSVGEAVPRCGVFKLDSSFQINKSLILKKAIDYIKYLQNLNNRLKQENMALKMAARKQSVKDLLVQGDITPPHSDAGSLSPQSETPSSPEDPRYTVVSYTFCLLNAVQHSAR